MRFTVSIGFVFWLLMLLHLILGIVWRAEIPGGRFGWAGSLFAWILFFLLGWATFGFPIHG